MPLHAYLSVIASDRRLIAFGVLMTFSSSFGQTYVSGIFGPAIQAEFGLGHTAWGAIYMFGTLASAAALPWTGRLIDRIDLRRYMAWVCAGGALACVLAASTTGPALLALAIFALRQSGQGLMSHVGVTSMARYFEAGRGRAIALASTAR